MSTAYQQPPNSLYTGALPDLNPDGGTAFEFIPPEDGWHELIFKIRYVESPDGQQVPEVRPYIYQGQLKPDSYQIRIEFHLTDPDTDVTPWREWKGWTIGENSALRPILMAIRKNEPFPTGQRLNIDFLREHEHRPFRALITVDEAPSTRTPGQTMYFPKIVKCEPVTAAKAGRRAAKVAGREATKPAPSTNEATDRQVQFIDKLARSLELSRKALDSESVAVAGAAVADLDRRGASALIDRLKQMQAEEEAAAISEEDRAAEALDDDTFPDLPN